MKRIILKVALVFFAVLFVTASAQGQAYTPSCAGTNDTAAFTTILTSIGSDTGTIRLPFMSGSRCAVNNLNLPANVTLDNTDGTGIKVNTGQLLTIAGPVVSPPKLFFANALSGQGTVSFSGNKVQTFVYPEWWGGGAGVAASTNASAFNAANTALVTIGTGEIKLGSGTYEFDSTFNLGSDAVAFTGISLGGTNGLVGTKLVWTGADNGTAIYCTRARYSHLHDFQLTYAEEDKGTTIGLRLSGPSTGTNNSGVMIERVDINGFDIGGLAGDGAGEGHDASEITLVGCTFESNNTGFRTDGSNTLNTHFYSCNFDLNTNIGIEINQGGSVHVYAGAWGRNPIGISVTTDTDLFVSGVRDEAISGSKFIVATGANITTQITVIGCSFQVDSGNETISGLGSFTLIGNQFGNWATAVIPFKGNSTASNGASLTMIGNAVHQSTTGGLFDTDTNSVGMTYTLSNNVKFGGVGGANGKWDDEEGVIDGNGNRVVSRRRTQTGVVSADIITFSSGDATPSVKYSTLFKTANAGATSITTFDDGGSGQLITVIVNDANTTFVNGATLATRSGSNIVAANGLTYSFVKDGTVWRQVN